ncbi:MAG: carboxypeptidase-like regulatory domain-containing protein [Bacteroidota bacterium]
MIDYLIQSSVCLIVFYAFYRFVLRKEKYFGMQRTYLLVTTLLSLTIPLMQLESPIQQNITQFISVPEIDAASTTNTNNASQEPASNSLSIPHLALWVYWSITAFMAIRLLLSFGRLLSLIRTSKVQHFEGFSLVFINGELPIASFYKYIFIDRNHQYSEEELQQIILHERKHIDDYHSIDLLVMALVRVVWWFNPISYWLNKDLRSIHEYTSDEAVLQHIDLKDYERLMIKALFIKANLPLISRFGDVSIKQRITMIKQKKSPKSSILKFALALPIACLMIVACSPDETSQLLPDDQGRIIHGIVQSQDGEPMPGINVVVKGTTTGTVTNLDGHYKIKLPDEGSILQFSFIGFETQSIPVKKKTVLDVEMVPGEDEFTNNQSPIDDSFDNSEGKLQYNEQIVTEDNLHYLKGTVLDKEGNPLEGVKVVVLGENNLSAQTDAAGNYTLSIEKTSGKVAYIYESGRYVAVKNFGE